MFKSTKEGTVELGKVLPPLSDEDLKTILIMFAECQEIEYLSKEEGVWKSDGKNIIK